MFLYKTLRKRNAASKHKSIDPHVPRVIVTEMIGVEPEQIDIVHSPHSAIIKTSTQYANQDILRQIIVTEGYATKPFKSEQDLETDHLDVVHDQWAISNSSSQLDNESFVNDPLFPDLMPPRDM